METRRLGRTGHDSSLAILGVAAFWAGTPDVVERVLHSALDAGVNHLDIAPQYGDAEKLVGPFLPALRSRVFVACKTMAPSADGARAQLEESLTVLGCDQFDLYQLHGVTSLDDLEGRAGAAGAIVQARDEGLVRYAGITGHDVGTPAAQAEALRRYDLDTVMFPVSPRMWADPAYRADAEALLALADERGVGVMAIKAVSVGPKSPGSDASTWYEPYRTASDIERGVRFTLSVPGVHAFCTPGDVRLLPDSFAAASGFTPMTPAEMAAAMDAVRHEIPLFPLPTA